jgi:hypothetical protein
VRARVLLLDHNPAAVSEEKGEFVKKLFAAAAAVLVCAAPASADVKITDQAYVRHDGGTDVTIADCTSDATTPTAGGDGSGERQQNEPTAAVNPLDPTRMTAGANDYCPVQTTTDAWAGFYYSSDSGATWVNSLLPGYPTDTSAAGQASPLYQFVTAAGDPVQAWDLENHLYYAGIAFNRARPANASIWAARYTWAPMMLAPDYEFTEIVSRGTPSPIFRGHFEDKVMIEVDRGSASPHQGNVYICWARFTGSGSNNFIELARSTDGGQTWSVQKVSGGIHGNQSCDIAVTRTGTVFVAWRQFEFQEQQRDAVAWVKSTNGGRSFTRPELATEFIAWDMGDSGARDCGDGPLACPAGYVFGRADSGPRITADPVAGEGDEAYVVVEASVPGTLVPTGTSYGTAGPGVGSQGSIYFLKTENGGADWTTPTRVDPIPAGHQFYPDIDANDGTLHVVYHDSRADNAAGPAGGDFRTVPFGNVFVGGEAESVAGIGLETWYSSSTDAGATWSHQAVSSGPYLQNYEQFGNRDVPFFGDYNYVSAVGDTVLMNWTDSSDTVAGVDPRYDIPAVAPDDGTDGFDVRQCRVFSGGVWSADLCPNAGGLDQNLYGFVMP